MTDRDKIRNIIELFIAWNGETEAIDVANLDSAVDFIANSLQEEPVAPKVLEDMLNAKTAAESLGISQEEHDKIVDSLIYGKEPELVDVDDLPNKEEEPVNEDLKEAAENTIEDLEQKLTNVTLDEVVRNWLRCMFRAGAQWQKQVFEKNRLTACDRATKEEIEREQDFLDKVLIGEQRQPTFSDAIEFGIKWQKKHLWKPADGDDLPEIDREVIVLIQDYSDDKDHLRVAFAHRPSKYTKVWNSDLGEEQVAEIEHYGKGEWNIPNVKYWLDVELPKEIEL